MNRIILSSIILLCLPFVLGDCYEPEFPVTVNTAVYVVDVLEVNDIDQMFKADIAVQTSWESKITERCLGAWAPELLILNARDVEQTYKTINAEDGVVTRLTRFYGDFSADMELENFPFDTAKLPITIITPVYDKEELFFIVSEATGGVGDYSIESWDITNEHTVVGDWKTSTGKIRSLYSFTMDAKRYPHFYYWKLIMPLIFIVFISWAVFWISPKEFGPQVSVGLISMLNIIAYNFAMSTFLPRVSFLTRADIFVTGCIVLVFLALVEAVVTGVFAQRKIKIARKIDRMCRVLFPALLALLLLVAFA